MSRESILEEGACLATPVGITAATGRGPTEADAILALKATLRKMAGLEVSDG